jgi:imidazolonepropionase-like amidohydrolase
MSVVALVLALFATPQDPPATPVTALRGAKIYTGAGAPLEGAVLLIQGRTIGAVGKDLAIPPGARVLELEGKVIIPGLVDPSSRVCLAEGERGAGSAEQSVLDTVDRYRDDWKEALAAGVTVIGVDPPSLGPVNGLGAVLELDPGRSVLRREAFLKVTLGAGGGDSSSAAERHQLYQNLRQTFESARLYAESWEKYRKETSELEAKRKTAKDEGKPAPPEPAKPRKDPRLDILVRTLDPKAPLPVRIEAHASDSILLGIKLAEEYKLRAILEGATEAYLVGEPVQKSGFPVIAGPVYRYGPPQVEFLRHSLGCAQSLVRRGVPVSIASLGQEKAGSAGAGGTRFLMESAALAASRGLSREEALQAITLQGARALGIEASHGSLEKGKAANFVVLSGEPFDSETRVEKTFVAGVPAFERTRE